MPNLPDINAELYASKPNVTLYDGPSRSAGKWGKAEGKRGQYRPYLDGEAIGTYTGTYISNNEGTWIKVTAYEGNWKTAKKGLIFIPFAGPFLYGNQVINPNTEPWDYWMNVADGEYDVSINPEAQEAADAEAAAAAKAKQKQALIDAVGGGNAGLTANSGADTAGASTYIWWIVGGVLVFAAGLVIWKVASKPKAQPAPLLAPKPVKLQ